MPEDLKDQRVIVLFSKAELDMIDDWSFANRIRSRGEAIRRLVASGVVRNSKSIKEARGARLMHELANEE